MKARWKCTTKKEPGETAEDIATNQDVIFSMLGRSYSFTIKARDVLKYGPHLGCPICKYITGEVATQYGHMKEGKIRILVEMEKDENNNRVRMRYVARSIDEGEVRLKGDDEGKAGEGGTPEKQEPRVTSSEDVHMPHSQ